MKSGAILLLSSLSGLAIGQTNANSSVISGTLSVTTNMGGPPLAAVHLTVYKDAECVKHSYGEFSLGRKQKPPTCSSELRTVTVDGHDSFEFSVAPGWYSLHILWATSSPGRPRVCKFPDWTIGYFPWRDSTRKYDMMAQQSSAFELKSGERKKIDFSYIDELSNPTFFSKADCVELQRGVGWVRPSDKEKVFPSPNFPPASPKSSMDSQPK